jgi:hypothetical protein
MSYHNGEFGQGDKILKTDSLINYLCSDQSFFNLILQPLYAVKNVPLKSQKLAKRVPMKETK